MTTSVLLGELACLAAAALWAVAVTVFRPAIRLHGARAVNLVKCALATLLQAGTVLALGQLGTLGAAPAASLLAVSASGVIGLALGDTALFAAVARLGVHRTMLLQTLAPVFAAAVAYAGYGETVTAGQAAGAVLILAGVALVVGRPPPVRAVPLPVATPVDPEPGVVRLGVLFGVVAAFGQGAGVVLAKAGMAVVPPLPASALRLGAATVALAAIGAADGALWRVPAALRAPGTLRRVVPATLLGTYVALFLMMAGIAYAPASIAAVLLATSPVFSLLIETVTERRAPRPAELLGTVAAVTGVAVLTLVTP